MRNLILATASPRRIDMLKDMGIKFRAVNSYYDEPERRKGQKPSEYVEANAAGKAKSILNKFRKEIIVGSDTVVVYKNRVLGKPRDMNEAFERRELRAVIDRVYPFEKAREALKYLRGGAHFGKVCLRLA